MNWRHVCMWGLWLVGWSAKADDINVSAAASLADALTQIAKQYESQHPGVNIKKSFAGSSILAKQIEQGAPADIFISADEDWMLYLQQRKLIRKGSSGVLLKNDLVLVAPKTAPPMSVKFDASLKFAEVVQGKICGGDPASVPAGKYAKQALGYYGWWDSFKPRWVGADDVRTALNFVERGECSLGVVYKTDALSSKQVQIVGVFPAESHKPIVYPIALTLKAGTQAQSFFSYLQGEEAAQVFVRLGFQLGKPQQSLNMK